jgi:hypothetical protein
MAEHLQAVRLTLVPAGKGPPLELRVRMALKGFLRRHGLRCVAIEPAAGAAEFAPAVGSPGPGLVAPGPAGGDTVPRAVSAPPP